MGGRTWKYWASSGPVFRAGPAFFRRAGFPFAGPAFFLPGRLLPDRLAQTGAVVKSRGFKAHPGFWPAKPALCTALVRTLI